MTGPRNPSELQRLEEERVILQTAILNNQPLLAGPQYLDKGLKAAKEAMLSELRNIERQLGIESIPYNDSRFGKE
jgi:ABC-type Fe3+/spermidine/putrescine transport system ATPase subunit